MIFPQKNLKIERKLCKGSSPFLSVFSWISGFRLTGLLSRLSFVGPEKIPVNWNLIEILKLESKQILPYHFNQRDKEQWQAEPLSCRRADDGASQIRSQMSFHLKCFNWYDEMEDDTYECLRHYRMHKESSFRSQCTRNLPSVCSYLISMTSHRVAG